MLVDFCDCRAKPKITCDKVSTDHNPVENLISSDYRKKNAGFIAESFVRPPVGVTVQFPCNIEIFRVIINPSVGAQKSCGFEIYTSSNKVNTNLLLSEQPCHISSNSSVFVPIGKIMIQDNGLICFTNHKFLHMSETEKKLVPSVEQYRHLGDLRHGRPSALTFVSHLTVRVTRTYSGSAVCIRQLEIWGRPSKSCSEKVFETLSVSFKPEEYSSEQDTHYAETNESELNKDIYLNNDLEIPDDFLDCITHEIMTVPMRLPCGKNIDQSTLEKHNSSEASWGRMPSDPFTGLVFDSKRKFEPNVPLKGRIDKFVLANMDQLKGVPRTLGRNIHKGPSVSRLTDKSNNVCTQSTSSYKDKKAEQHLQNDFKHFNSDQVIELDEGGDFTSVHVHSYIGKKRKREETKNSDTNISKSVASKHCKTNEVIDLTGSNSSTSSNIHTNDLTDSLNSALASTLRTLPFFTKTLPVTKTTPDCSFCNKSLDCFAYKMTCSHLICRLCITESSNAIVCKSCHSFNNRQDIVRVHV